MARTRFNAPNIGNCTLVYYSELGSSVSVSGPIYFPGHLISHSMFY